MNNLLKASFAVGAVVVALSANAKAQTVEVNGIGSSGLFLELGLGASSAKGTIMDACVWSENTGTVVATDTSTGTSLTDKGNSWVAWSRAGGGCGTPGTGSTIYAYLSADSVVGNRCLYNANLSTPECTIAYPTTSPAPAGLILGTADEVALPAIIASKLNASIVNMAGTDIRPEDAEFATDRALKPCGVPVATGSQYFGLGYTNGSTIKSAFSASLFNVINFTLPKAFAVTPVGATPIVVVVNGNGDAAGLNQSGVTNLTTATLAKFLDGTYSYADQALSSPSASGDKVYTLLREPLSGTYNTMEFNAPNTVANMTSQDAGVNQPSAQVNCSGSHVLDNPLIISTPSGGARERAIGTGQELAEVIATPNSIGYGFWSTANFAGFTPSAAPNAKYLMINGVDPLLKSGISYTGTVPVTGSADLRHVDLHTVANGTYPIWSLLRLVNIGSSALPAVTNLATSAQSFTTFGSSTSRPDFIVPSSLTVVRSHFKTPVGLGEPSAVANGHVGLPSSACTAPESGGDVGGVILSLRSDSSYCSANDVTTGQTGERQ